MHVSVKIKKLFKKIGITIDRYPIGDLKQRIKLINYFGINIIYDIGANKGQYAKLMRELGFKGRIISIEPLKDAFNILQKKSAKDPLWHVINCGVGKENGELILNVSKNSVSSSFQDMLPAHIENSPNSVYIRKEKVKVIKFDDIFKQYHQQGDIAWLKIDTQGFEMNVLKGSHKALDIITAIQMEMSLSQTYQNEVCFTEVMEFLRNKKFKLFSIERGHANKKSGQQYQADGVFFKQELDQK